MISGNLYRQWIKLPVLIEMKIMKTIGEKAAEYLRSQNITQVGHGDCHLLHDIAAYCGIPHRSWRTEEQILNALDRNVKSKSLCLINGTTGIMD